MIINTFIGYFFIGENELKINFIYRLDGGRVNGLKHVLIYALKSGCRLNRDTWDQQIIDLHGT